MQRPARWKSLAAVTQAFGLFLVEQQSITAQGKSGYVGRGGESEKGL